MLPLLEQHRAAIDALCRQYHVKRLELFGSAARGQFDPASGDLDFFVEFEDLGWKGSFKRYMGLKLALEQLLGQQVDLVELDAVTNPHFRQVATARMQPLYAA
jgi:predicted nucleotidyltransferase